MDPLQSLLTQVMTDVSPLIFLYIGCEGYNSHDPSFHDMNKVAPYIFTSMESS